MSDAESRPPDPVDDQAVPPVEDASELDAPAEQPVSEDTLEEARLDTTARSLNGDDPAEEVATQQTGSAEQASPGGRADSTGAPESQAAPSAAELADDDASDAGHIPDEDVAAAPAPTRSARPGDWESELSSHAVALELRRIEDDVRALLGDRDPKRKRRLNGTNRWHELEEELIGLQFSGRFDDDTIRRLRELIYQRHYLFNRLRFLASTRPTWNT